MFSDIRSYLLSEASAIVAAPALFFMSLLVAGSIIWWVLNWSYAARLESYKARLDAKSDENAQLLKRLEAATKDAPSKVPQREAQADPDAISQAGRTVGRVVGGEVRRADGVLIARSMFANGDFNKSKPFEYRGESMIFERADMEGRGGSFGQIHQSFQNVVCRIL